MSGTTSCTGVGLVIRRRLRIERTDLGNHVRKVIGVDAADRHQPPHIPTRQQFEIVEQRRHRRIQPVEFGKLCGQALLQVAREQPHRVEAHHARTHRLDPLERDRHRIGDRRGLRGQPPGWAEQRDQMRTDHPVHGIVEREPKLLAEMLAQRSTLGRDIFDAAIVGLEVARPAMAVDRLRRRAAIGRATRIVGLAEIGIERRRTLGRQRVRLGELSDIGGLGDPLGTLVRRHALGVGNLRPVIALEQRIAFQLLVAQSSPPRRWNIAAA